MEKALKWQEDRSRKTEEGANWDLILVKGKFLK